MDLNLNQEPERRIEQITESYRSDNARYPTSFNQFIVHRDQFPRVVLPSLSQETEMPAYSIHDDRLDINASHDVDLGQKVSIDFLPSISRDEDKPPEDNSTGFYNELAHPKDIVVFYTEELQVQEGDDEVEDEIDTSYNSDSSSLTYHESPDIMHSILPSDCEELEVYDGDQDAVTHIKQHQPPKSPVSETKYSNDLKEQEVPIQYQPLSLIEKTKVPVFPWADTKYSNDLKEQEVAIQYQSPSMIERTRSTVFFLAGTKSSNAMEEQDIPIEYQSISLIEKTKSPIFSFSELQHPNLTEDQEGPVQYQPLSLIEKTKSPLAETKHYKAMNDQEDPNQYQPLSLLEKSKGHVPLSRIEKTKSPLFSLFSAESKHPNSEEDNDIAAIEEFVQKDLDFLDFDINVDGIGSKLPF